MIDNQRICNWLSRVTTVVVIAHGSMAWAQPPAKLASSFMPVDQMEPIAEVIARMKAEKAAIAQKHAGLLDERYNLGDIPAENASMSRGKPLQMRARAKLSMGITWEQLSALSPQQIRQGDVFPIGFLL